MLTPGRGYSGSRLWTAEEDIRRQDANKDARHSRDSAPYSGLRGKHRGVTTDEIAKDTAATVTIWYHDGTDYVETETTVEARCWFLNTGDTIPANTRVIIEKMADLQWEITNAWCEVSDIE